jgi:hypothetical protein
MSLLRSSWTSGLHVVSCPASLLHAVGKGGTAKLISPARSSLGQDYRFYLESDRS